MANDRRPGRRPIGDNDDESVPVCVRLPQTQYDTYWHRAKRDGVSVPEVIRRDLSERERPKK